jgi:hypothetical protein
MRYTAFFTAFFLLLSITVFSQRQYSTYQKDGYVGLEFVENHTQITLPIYEKITPCYEAQSSTGNLYRFHTVYSKHQAYPNVNQYSVTNYWKVVKNGKCGVIDCNGKFIVPMLYDNVEYLIDTSFIVISINNKVGVIDRNGSFFIDPIYNNIRYYKNSTGSFILKASTWEYFYLINETGDILSKFPSTLEVTSIKDNRIIVTNKYSRLQGSYDLAGREILPMIYDQLDINLGMYSFKLEEQAGLIDLAGNLIFSRACNEILPVKENRYMIGIKRNTYQLTNEKGALLCKDTFSTIKGHADFIIVQSASTRKYGLISYDGEFIIPMTYSSLNFWNGMLVAKKEATYGIISSSEKVLLPFTYEVINVLSDTSFLLVKQKGRYGCIDKNLKMVLPCKYENLSDIWYVNNHVGSAEAARFVSQKGNKSGVIDIHGNITQEYKVIEFIENKKETYENGFSSLPAPHTDYFHLKKIKRPIGKGVPDGILLNEWNQEILRCESRLISVYNDYFILGNVNRKYGLIAGDGITIIPFIYNQLYPIANDYFVARNEKYYGILNRSGSVAVPFQYSGLNYVSDQYIIARDTNSTPTFGLIDYSGNIQIPFEYKYLQSNKKYGKNFLVAKKDSLYGLIDTTNSVLIPFMYHYIEQLNTNVFHVQKNGKHGIVNFDNKIIIPIMYDELFYSRDIIDVKNNGKYGVLNKDNQTIIPLNYDAIYPPALSDFLYGKIFIVKKADKVGSVDSTGKMILPIEFSSIDYYNNACVVIKNSNYYFVNGSVVHYNEPYEEITMYGNIFRTKNNNGKQGIADYTGQVILAPIYDKVEFGYEGFVVEKDGQTATFSRSGKMTTPFANK